MGGELRKGRGIEEGEMERGRGEGEIEGERGRGEGGEREGRGRGEGGERVTIKYIYAIHPASIIMIIKLKGIPVQYIKL